MKYNQHSEYEENRGINLESLMSVSAAEAEIQC